MNYYDISWSKGKQEENKFLAIRGELDEDFFQILEVCFNRRKRTFWEAAAEPPPEAKIFEIKLGKSK